MKKIYILKGLDCPHCSAKIEAEAQKISCVSNAVVSLMEQTLTIESDDFDEDIDKTVTDIVHKHEPDVEILNKTNFNEKIETSIVSEQNSFKMRILRLTLGAVMYASALILTSVFKINGYLKIILFALSYFVLGIDVVVSAVKNIFKGKMLDENFLMTVSSIGAFVINSYSEANVVMLLYQIGELFQDMAVGKSRKSIEALIDIRPDSANVIRGGKTTSVHPSNVMIGEVIIVQPGEKIPLDGTVCEGYTTLDTSALTGESAPKSAKVGDEVLSGCINKTGVIKIIVKKSFSESTATKIIDLIRNASSKKAPSEKFITKFARIYTPVVVSLALVTAVAVPLILGGGFKEWIQRAFIFLVISCPCALVISIPLAFFGGIGSAARRGILVKGGNYLETLSKLDTLVVDKTGTLTEGRFAVRSVFAAQDFSNDDLLFIAAYSEHFSNHPIAQSVKEHVNIKINEDIIENYTEISGKGISVDLNGKKVLAGNFALMEENFVDAAPCTEEGSVVYFSLDGKYVGYITVADKIKSDSAKAVSALKREGIKKIIMLTGDNKRIAEIVSQKLKLTSYYAELLPGDKVKIFEEIAEKSNGAVAFAGDGINDAPTLARADVGIAMGALGSDAAVEAADVVLMTDEISLISDAVKISKKTLRIVKQNIVISLGIKFFFLILGFFGIATMWEAIFSDVGVMIIAVANSMRLIKK